MVPREYSNECIVKQPTPYAILVKASDQSRLRTGTLDIGRVVWTRKALHEAAPAEKLDAFVFGVGSVELNSNDLTQN